MSAARKLVGPDSDQLRIRVGHVHQSSQSDWSTSCTSARRKRRQKRLRKWRRRVVRRRRRCQAQAAIKEASLKHIIGVPNQTFESKSKMALNLMVLCQKAEASTVPNTASVDYSRTVKHDHLLLVVKAMVNGAVVNALVDSGATRSFISDQMKT